MNGSLKDVEIYTLSQAHKFSEELEFPAWTKAVPKAIFDPDKKREQIKQLLSSLYAKGYSLTNSPGEGMETLPIAQTGETKQIFDGMTQAGYGIIKTPPKSTAPITPPTPPLLQPIRGGAPLRAEPPSSADGSGVKPSQFYIQPQQRVFYRKPPRQPSNIIWLVIGGLVILTGIVALALYSKKGD